MVRRVDDGRGVVLKLAQKVRAYPADPETVSITNMYLDFGEYELLRGFPGRELRKRRWHLVHEGRRFAVDEFQDRLRGLVLAETELDVDEDRLPLPPFAITDVTREDRFSGGALAFAEDEDLHRLFTLTRTAQSERHVRRAQSIAGGSRSGGQPRCWTARSRA